VAISIGSLLIRLGLDSGEFKSGLTGAEQAFRRTVRNIERSGRDLQSRGEALTIGVTAPLAALGAAAVRGFVEQSRAIADVDAALRSMGGAAGRSSRQLAENADAMEMRSLFDADVILKQVTANLLTFGNIAGREFDRAQQAAIDMATRLGGEPQAAAMQLGKALNDPVDGITKLTRVGVVFTEQQKAQVRQMAALGDTAAAQGVILSEVERQFRGAAQAAADATPWRQAQVAINQAMDTIGEAALPAITNVAQAVADMARAFSSLSPEMQKAVITGLAVSAALGPLLTVTGALIRSGAGVIAMFRVFTPAVAASAVAAGSATPAIVGLRAAMMSLASSMVVYAAAAAPIALLVAALVIRHRELARASAAAEQAVEASGAAAEVASKSVDKLARATGEARRQALENVRALQRETVEKVRSARASLVLAQAELARARSMEHTINQSAAIGDTSGILFGSDQRIEAENEVTARQRALNTLTGTLQELNRAVADAARPAAPLPSIPLGGESSGASGGGARGAGGSGVSDPAAVERRFADELGQYMSQIAAARQSQALSVSEVAELEGRQLEHTRLAAQRALAADTEYSDVQKQRLSLQIDALADEERDAIAFRERQALERERADLAQSDFDTARDQLALRGELADTDSARRDIALQILDLEQQYRRNQLELVAASSTASEAERARAQALLQSLGAIEASERSAAARRSETQVEQYLRSLKQSPQQISESLDRITMDGLDAFNQGLVDALVNFRSLGDVARGVIRQILADLLTLQIRQAIIGPLAGALGLGAGAAKGGGGGFLSGLLGAAAKSFGGGKAVGGPVDGRKMYLVGERGPELFAPGRNGSIIPNDALRSAGGGGAPNFHITVQGAMNDSDARRTGTQVGAAAAREFARARRSGLAG
jgi:hypothetical protein